jgi:hypothetical protein
LWRRWAGLAAVALLVVIVLVVALEGHPPALYWQGEPMAGTAAVLSRAEASMAAVASADEGALSKRARCYFSLAGAAAHDVRPALMCGPVFLPWSSPRSPWLAYRLRARLRGSAEELSVSLYPPPSETVALAKGEVLRRPDGSSPPPRDGGVAVPAVPRQQPGWGGLLSAPPAGLRPAPVGALLGDWGRTYRLVAFGKAGWLPSRLDQAALASAVVPPGSAYGTRPSRRPVAKLLLPPAGEVFVLAELAVSSGEAAGPVASDAGTSTADMPSLAVVAGTTDVTVAPQARPGSELTVAAAVPAGSRPVLEVTDRGLTQEVSLADGEVLSAPAILSRPATNEALSATGQLAGAKWRFSAASLVWFAGSDGGTVPPRADEAYLEVLAKAKPASASFLPASDFRLELPGGEVVPGQLLPDADRAALLVGFVVPASFSDGTVVATVAGRSLDVAVRFP